MTDRKDRNHADEIATALAHKSEVGQLTDAIVFLIDRLEWIQGNALSASPMAIQNAADDAIKGVRK